MPVLLETTRETDLQPFVAGVPIYSTVRQIRSLLQKALSADHAMLFAEPNANQESGDIQWFAPFNGKKVRLTDLEGSQVAAINSELARLVNDIAQHAETLVNSDSANDRVMGHNLELALEIPGEQYIYVVDGRPVLAAWGHGPRGPATQRRTLMKRVAQFPRVSRSDDRVAPPGLDDRVAPPGLVESPPSSGRYRTEISRATLASVPMVVHRFGWLTALLWLLFVLVLLAIGYLLLYYCALGWPGSVNDLHRSILNFCPSRAVVAEAAPSDGRQRQRQRQLLDTLDDLDRRLKDKRNACVVELPRPKAEPPRALEPEMPVLKPPPQAQIGAVNVILRWETDDDLDLYVHCPNGTGTIYFSRRTVCGGTLDVDANAGAAVANPAENIFWPKDAAPHGEFVVEVNLYTKRSTHPNTPFQVALLIDGKQVELHQGIVDASNPRRRVFVFRMPYAGR